MSSPAPAPRRNPALVTLAAVVLTLVLFYVVTWVAGTAIA